MYEKVSKENYLQLFLSDYSNCFVAKVVKVSSQDESIFAPSYYKDNNFEVERWFIIEDFRELARGDFEFVRDDILSNFTTPNFNNHTYAIYGNEYTYPLIIDMKKEIKYFDEAQKYYPNVYKSKEFLEVKDNLKKYSFGTQYIDFMHPDSMENIIYAEIEYSQNCQDRYMILVALWLNMQKLWSKSYIYL